MEDVRYTNGDRKLGLVRVGDLVEVESGTQFTESWKVTAGFVAETGIEDGNPYIIFEPGAYRFNNSNRQRPERNRYPEQGYVLTVTEATQIVDGAEGAYANDFVEEQGDLAEEAVWKAEEALQAALAERERFQEARDRAWRYEHEYYA